MQQLCPACRTLLSDTFFFCPNCGKKIKSPPLSTSVTKQIGVYLLSLFLPPLGLWPGIRYLRQNDQKAKTIGIIAIVLTLLSTIVTTWITFDLVNNLQTTLNKQMNQYQNLGL